MKGDWLFTCKMIPVQFDCFLDEDNFRTLDGSEHSYKHCGFKPISREYALWFLSNEIYKHYNKLKDFSKLSPFKRIESQHYIRNNDNLEFHYKGKYPLLKNRHSSYGGRFYEKWLIYKEIRLELKDNYDSWDLYEQYVKKLCEISNIKFEGI